MRSCNKAIEQGTAASPPTTTAGKIEFLDAGIESGDDNRYHYISDKDVGRWTLSERCVHQLYR